MDTHNQDKLNPTFAQKTVLFEGTLGIIGALGAWITGLALWNAVIPETISDFKTQAFWGLVLTVLLIAVMWAVQCLPFRGIQRLSTLSQRIIFPLLKHTTFMDRFCVCLSAGVGEELLFRGFIQTLIIVYWPWGTDWGLNAILGIGVSAFLFGLGHSLTRSYTLIATGLGVSFGIVYYRTGALLIPIIAHTLYDVWAMQQILWQSRNDNLTDLDLP